MRLVKAKRIPSIFIITIGVFGFSIQRPTDSDKVFNSGGRGSFKEYDSLLRDGRRSSVISSSQPSRVSDAVNVFEYCLFESRLSTNLSAESHVFVVFRLLSGYLHSAVNVCVAHQQKLLFSGGSPVDETALLMRSDLSQSIPPPLLLRDTLRRCRLVSNTGTNNE